LLLAAALLVLAGALAYFEHAYRGLAHALERDLATARAYRWERPVLRGAMGNGNAADEIYAALHDWQPLGRALRHAIADKVYYGLPLDAAQLLALEARGIALRALRGAAQQGFSHTELVVERGSQMRVPDYPRLSEAALGLLAEAQRAAPDACLQEATDVLRIGQDSVPSAPLEAVSVNAHLHALAARVIARCALHADMLSLRRTTHELRVLATHPAPTGTGIELQELAIAADYRARAGLTSQPTPWHVAETMAARPQLLAAWSGLSNAARFRRISPERYPDALEDWKREQDLRARTHPELESAAAQVAARLEDDMRAQAIVRMLCVALSALSERAYRGVLPQAPGVLRETALLDPFRAQPLRYSVSSNGAELTLWSVGADYRDDGGSDEWTETGPRDVTLHVALR
jgi:hypothetical protein